MTRFREASSTPSNTWVRDFSWFPGTRTVEPFRPPSKVGCAGHLIALVTAIQPSELATANEPGDKIHNCVIENARPIARQIRQSEPLLKVAVERNGPKRCWPPITPW